MPKQWRRFGVNHGAVLTMGVISITPEPSSSIVKGGVGRQGQITEAGRIEAEQLGELPVIGEVTPDARQVRPPARIFLKDHMPLAIDAQVVEHLVGARAVQQHLDTPAGRRGAHVLEDQAPEAGSSLLGPAAGLHRVEAIGGDEVEAIRILGVPGAVLGAQKLGHPCGLACGLQVPKT